MDIETHVAPGEATQNPTPEVVAQENPEVAAPETDAEGQSDQQTETTSNEDEATKAIRRMERRIARLTAARYEAEAKAKQAAEEAQRYRQQYEQPQQEQQQQQVDPIQLASQIATLQTVTQKANEVARRGAEKFPDFGDAVRAVNEEAGPLFSPQGFPTALGEAILEADDPPALLHYLGKNPDIAAELHGLTPIQAARKVARIEAQMQTPKEPKVSQAPKPIRPVTAAQASASDLRPDMPIEEWMRLRQEQLEKRRRY